MKKLRSKSGVMMTKFSRMPNVVRRAVEVNQGLPAAVKRKLAAAWSRDYLDNVNRKLYPRGLYLKLDRGGGEFLVLRSGSGPVNKQRACAEKIAKAEFAKFLDFMSTQPFEYVQHT